MSEDILRQPSQDRDSAKLKAWAIVMPGSRKGAHPWIIPSTVRYLRKDAWGALAGNETISYVKKHGGKAKKVLVTVVFPCISPKQCPECKGDLVSDSDYPNDLLCGRCNKVFDAKTLEFVEAF